MPMMREHAPIMPLWEHMEHYKVQGKIESLTKTRSFFHWFWLKEILEVTLVLSYPEKIGTFKNINGTEIQPPEKVIILSSNFSLKVGDVLDLSLGYTQPFNQLHHGISPFTFKFTSGNVVWWK